MTTTTITTAQIKVRKGHKADSDEVRKLLDDGFSIVDAFAWYVGPNYGGESPTHNGFVINFRKTTVV